MKRGVISPKDIFGGNSKLVYLLKSRHLNLRYASTLERYTYIKRELVRNLFELGPVA